MGANKSIAASVSFSRPSLVYRTGEQVNGFIYFHNKRKKYTLKKLSIDFIGELEYLKEGAVLINDGLGGSRTEYRREIEKIQLVNSRHVVLYPKDNEHEITLQPGQHSWPFEFNIPQNLPPSIDSSFSIKYYVMIVIDKPWFPINSEQIYPLTILPVIDIYTQPQGREPVTLSRQNSQQLEFKLYLHRRGIIPGKNISLDIDIENPMKLKIEKARATLVQYQTISDTEHVETIFQKEISELIGFNQTELHQTFDIHVPYSHLAPTCFHKLKLSNSSITTEISYEVHLDIKFEGLVDRMKFSIPIIIGTESSREQIDDVPISYENAVQEMNLPPSYESVIANLQS